MGGPMNVHQHRTFPWLADEKSYISRCIARSKLVLGICLGAQLLADVLGAHVVRNPHVEIGWFPVTLTREAAHSRIFRDLPGRFVPFHWHGDTFSTPPGALRTVQSEACANQAFQRGDRLVGLQFHLDYKQESLRLMMENCGEELVEAPSVQTAEEMLRESARLETTRELLDTFMDRMAEANS
jgi:GMP synthase-like glutamine amidotransferase